MSFPGHPSPSAGAFHALFDAPLHEDTRTRLRNANDPCQDEHASATMELANREFNFRERLVRASPALA